MSAISPSAMASRNVSDQPADRLSRILGEQATVAFDGRQTVVEPHTENACARALSVCGANGWHTVVRGNGSWLPNPPPAPVAISTVRMGTILDVRPADLYATVQAGVTADDLARELARHDVWLPIDPPGAARTVGSILASATQGGLRTGFGGVRDQVLGLTVVTGSGRILRLGGRVVKNVAGFDLAKLVIGGFGAYGIVTAAHVKVRAIPPRDATMQISGERAHLLDAAIRILAGGMTPAVLQFATNGSRETITARTLGSRDLVDAELAGIRRACGDGCEELSNDRAQTWWTARRSAAIAEPATIRIGTTPTGVARALEIVERYGGTSTVAFGFGGATLRWNGQAGADELLHMRRRAAEHEMPFIVERAAVDALTAVGHYGPLPGGSQRLARSLQAVFDPAGILSRAVWAA